jgi:putative hemolysin
MLAIHLEFQRSKQSGVPCFHLLGLVMEHFHLGHKPHAITYNPFRFKDALGIRLEPSSLAKLELVFVSLGPKDGYAIHHIVTSFQNVS